MEYKNEMKNCQNCKNDFTIESDDFSFYEKIKVPPPTFCPECQFVRRMIFRNQNTLHRRTDDAPDGGGKKIISIYSEDKPLTVYNREYWWGDSWDPYEYGMDVDFSRPFFEQIRELIQKVPWPNLMNWNAVNSDYCNSTSDNKNCYLVFGGDYNEDCAYSTFNFHSKNSQDLYLCDHCDLCYESTDIEECYKVRFAQYSKSCTDCMFIYDCINCTNCIGCVSLRNKSNCIFNQQYTKEEYDRIKKELCLETRSGMKAMREKFAEFKLGFPHRFAHIIKSVNCTGDNIVEAKNCKNCFDLVPGGEDLKNVFLSGGVLKDSRNMSHAGHGSELLYDSFGVFAGCRNVKFSIYQSATIDTEYAYNCPSGFNLFGCVGIKNGSYSILNKKYSKEEYNVLVPKIIEHMNTMPFIDAQGRIYKYGEFFPPEFSPFGYNETIAYDYFPLTREVAIARGYKWHEREDRAYNIDIKSEEIPESFSEATDNVFTKVFECSHKEKCLGHQCAGAFKLIPSEIQFYQRMELPLPDTCSNCRHYLRLRSRNPMKLWHRECMCTKENHNNHEGKCTVEFETSYAPDRPEIVYCEKCYQQEVY